MIKRLLLITLTLVVTFSANAQVNIKPKALAGEWQLDSISHTGKTAKGEMPCIDNMIAYCLINSSWKFHKKRTGSFLASEKNQGCVKHEQEFTWLYAKNLLSIVNKEPGTPKKQIEKQFTIIVNKLDKKAGKMEWEFTLPPSQYKPASVKLYFSKKE